MPRLLKSLGHDWSWLVLLGLSVVLNVALARRIQILNAQIPASSPAVVNAGERLNPVSALDEASKAVVIRFDSVATPTLLYVMHPTCGWCLRNNPNLKSLIKQADGRYRVIILSTGADGVAAYRRAHDIAQPIYVVSEETMRDYKLGGTPQSLLVGSDGIVIENWVGFYKGALKRKIETTLNIALPED